MHIWTLTRWQKTYSRDEFGRTGLRLRFDKDVHVEVRRACLVFCRWLKTEYVFPIRVPVYIKSARQIKAMDGELVSATIFLPDNRFEEPYIRVSTGDYEELERRLGQDDALATILMSISHEITHYYQWINDVRLTSMGAERQAVSYARFILDEYAQTHEQP